MSRPRAIDGTRYVPRQTSSGSPEAPLERIRNRARGMLRSQLLDGHEKDLVRLSLARIKETGTLAGKAAERGDRAEAARLEGQRTEMVSLLSLLLTDAEEKAANIPARLMTGRCRPR